MLTVTTITVSPSQVMEHKRDTMLQYYHDTKEQLTALALLRDSMVITLEQASDYALPITRKYKYYRQWLDDYTISLLSSLDQPLNKLNN